MEEQNHAFIKDFNSNLPVIREMVKAAGLDNRLLHSSIKIVHDDAIVNAGKMAEGARQVQIFAPARCGKSTCSFCYSYAEYGTIKNWTPK